MPFWLDQIYQRKCMGRCGKKATYELHSPINEVQGYYCKSCGEREMKKLNADPSIERNLREYSRQTFEGS